jgi:nicotinate phosphoribosyltransferase
MLAKSPALSTDFYELTMAACYHAQGMQGSATFSLFPHDLPASRNFLVAAGLETVLDYLQNFRFTSEDIDYLASLGRFQPDFLKYLAGMRFTGEVWAMPEGTICFGGEPILEITAPVIEGQLVETFLINAFNLNSMLASKAARCVVAAQGKALVDFGLRRTPGLDAGLASARAASLVGFEGTSNVAAAAHLGARPVGTMAHSFVVAFGEETEAFESFAATFPDSTVFLVDTYDSLSGLKKAVKAALRLRDKGHELVGIRLDSGDLAEMSRKAREMLNQAGFQKAKVVVSGNLDEYRIEELIQNGAAVDMYAVGTKMGSSADAPFLDLAYKLVSYEGRPTLKLSTGKVTWAAPKQLWRQVDEDGVIINDVLGLRDEAQKGRPLLEKVMQDGEPVNEVPGWREAREVFKKNLAQLPEECLDLHHKCRVEVQASRALKDLQERAKKAALNGLSS